MAGVGIDSFLRTLDDKLEPPIQEHLKNVYSCLAMSALAAAAGGYIHVFTGILQGGLLTTIIGIGLIIYLAMTPDDGKNRATRLGCLLGFAFMSGLGLGPLLEAVINVDPSIIPTAFIGTSVVFIGFSLSALLSNHRKWLYLGGILMSGLTTLTILALMSLFMRSQMLFQVQLYLGLAIMCGFIMYDTQLIVEKRRRGDKDFIWHSVDLFIDMIGVFRRLLILLGQKEERKKKN
jgi:FtsH-binding integral membrane protein